MTQTHIQTNHCYPPKHYGVLALWLRNHATRKRLRCLTSEQLTDLGLTRDQVSAEGRKWFWQ